MKSLLPMLPVLLMWSAAGFAASAPEQLPDYASDYVGQQQRSIKSLSDSDIEQLRNGQGWGLAKAAELNGLPGPSHVLQMAAEIDLSPEQEAEIQALFDTMKARAIPLGLQLIELERTLDEGFAAAAITPQSLQAVLSEIAGVHQQLRYVHLVTHLQTPNILSAAQIRRYNTLRGYGDGDNCLKVPTGHDAEMWKQHNNCP